MQDANFTENGYKFHGLLLVMEFRCFELVNHCTLWL